MDATLLLADAAQVNGGKVSALGLGWSRAQLNDRWFTAASALVVIIDVPWDQLGTPLPWSLHLVDTDGAPVPAPNGTEPMRFEGMLSTTRDESLVPGSSLSAPLAVSLPPLRLAPGRFQWRLEARGELVAHRAFDVAAAS